MGTSCLPDTWVSPLYMGILRFPDTCVSLFFIIFFLLHVILALGSVQFCYSDTALDLGLRLLVWQEELFPTLLVVQGDKLFMRPWSVGTSGFYGLSLPSVGGDTHRDNSVDRILVNQNLSTVCSGVVRFNIQK